MANETRALTKFDIFRQVINSDTIRAQVKNSLKENSGAFLSSVIDLYNSDTALQECDPQKVAMECVKAAALRLPLTKALGYAYVVPYNKVPTFIIGYKGLIQLALRTGLYKNIHAGAVLEGVYTGENWLTGEVFLDGQPVSKKVVGYIAYFKLISGFEKSLYMTVEEVDAHAKRFSKSYNSSYSPWKTDFDAMACKTVLRKLLKYGPISIEMAEAFSRDDDDIEGKANREAQVWGNAEVRDIPTPKLNPPKQEQAQTEPEQQPEPDHPMPEF